MDVQIVHLDHEFGESETAASSRGDLWSNGRTAGDQRASVACGNSLADLTCRGSDIRAREVVGEDRGHIPSLCIVDVEVIVDAGNPVANVSCSLSVRRYHRSRRYTRARLLVAASESESGSVRQRQWPG